MTSYTPNSVVLDRKDERSLWTTQKRAESIWWNFIDFRHENYGRNLLNRKVVK